MRKYIAMILTVLLAALPTFAQTVDDHAKAKKGAVIGGVAGAIAGAVIGNNRGHHSSKRGAVVGGIAGTAAGAIVGAMMDKQERELRQIQGVNVTRVDQNDLKVTVGNDVLFDFNSAALRQASRDSLSGMADVFQKYPDTTIAVQGHTDSQGSHGHNMKLSCACFGCGPPRARGEKRPRQYLWIRQVTTACDQQHGSRPSVEPPRRDSRPRQPVLKLR